MAQKLSSPVQHLDFIDDVQWFLVYTELLKQE